MGFFVIITVERKKIRPMKNFAKIALGVLIVNNLLSTERPRKERCGRVRNNSIWEIPNNGGL